MTPAYLRRSLEPVLRRAAGQFPAVVLTGPRQSGKTTLLKRLFSATHGYVSLELPDIRAAATADPRGFLEAHPPPVIFDEVQHAPELLPYVKERIDEHRQRHGQYLLTGSQNLLVLEKVTETLAGRAAILRLDPLSQREIEERPEQPFPWEATPPVPAGRTTGVEPAPSEPLAFGRLWSRLWRGAYPEPALHPDLDAVLWHSSYIQTYLERDVRSVRQVGDLTAFDAFLRALAARNGQILSLSDLSRDLGLAVNTVKAWVSVLEASYQVIVLRPYFVNLGKRLVKTPKLYFTDVGTLSYLTGLREPDHLASGPLGGSILEAAVLSEVSKVFHGRGHQPWIYFWRTASGSEVDLLVDTGQALIPIEVKQSATPRPAMTSGIRALREALGERVGPGFVIHPGDVRLPLGSNVLALPFGEL